MTVKARLEGWVKVSEKNWERRRKWKMIPGRGNPAMRLYEITLVWCALKSVPLCWHLHRPPSALWFPWLEAFQTCSFINWTKVNLYPLHIQMWWVPNPTGLTGLFLKPPHLIGNIVCSLCLREADLSRTQSLPLPGWRTCGNHFTPLGFALCFYKIMSGSLQGWLHE